MCGWMELVMELVLKTGRRHGEIERCVSAESGVQCPVCEYRKNRTVAFASRGDDERVSRRKLRKNRPFLMTHADLEIACKGG